MSDSSLVLGRSIPPTNAVSEILEHADVGADSKVLHIGTGAGYVTALLSKLAAQVISIENNPSNARYKKLPIINVLRDKLNMEDTVLYRRLAEENDLPFAPIDELLPQVQPELMEAFSRSFLDGHHLVPLKVDDHSLHVATDDPDSSVDDILHMYPYERVHKVLVTPNDFKRLWTTVELSLQGDAKQLWGAAAKEKEQADAARTDWPRLSCLPLKRSPLRMPWVSTPTIIAKATWSLKILLISWSGPRSRTTSVI